MNVKKKLFIMAGSASVAVGTAGIVIPLVPTVPFLLLAAFCFARSSERFHHWLIHHRLFGEYIRNYREKGGMALKHKIRSLILLWAGIGYTFFFALSDVGPEVLLVVRFFLLSVLIGVTAHILKLKTVK